MVGAGTLTDRIHQHGADILAMLRRAGTYLLDGDRVGHDRALAVANTLIAERRQMREEMSRACGPWFAV